MPACGPLQVGEHPWECRCSRRSPGTEGAFVTPLLRDDLLPGLVMIISHLASGLSVADVAQRHGVPVQPVWAMALDGKDDRRVKPLGPGIWPTFRRGL